MNISQKRHEFTVYVVDDEQSVCNVIREALSHAGYRVQAFTTAEEALVQIEKSPPHLVFSDIQMEGLSGIELLEKVRIINPDMGFIVMTSFANVDSAVAATRLGANDYLYKPLDNLNDLIKTTDNVCERIHLGLENRRLLDEMTRKNVQLNRTNIEMQHIHLLTEKLAQTLEPDAVIQSCLDSLSVITGGSPTIFLSYVQDRMCLAIKQASTSFYFKNDNADVNSEFILAGEIKNVAIKLTGMDPLKISEFLLFPQKMSLLSKFVREIFNVDKFSAAPFIHKNQSIGIIVIFGVVPEGSLAREIDSLVQISQLSYINASLAKQVQELSVKDSLTGLFDRRHFNQKLDEELSRTRRTQQPLTLIYLDIDYFKNYNDSNGTPMGDLVIQKVAQIFQKIGRNTDIAARVAGEEFAILCPNTSLQGGTIHAEKIRAAIEKTIFLYGEKQPLGKVTISLGVSEFPSVAHDAATLVTSVEEALQQSKRNGRNRWTAAVAPAGHKAEYEPKELIAKRSAS